jgi:hypothetical protein
MQDSSTPEAEQQFGKDVKTADTLDTTRLLPSLKT